MPYTRIQFIAHSINTGPKNCVWRDHQIVSGEYVGLTTATADIRERCALLGRALRAAQPLAHTSSETLKLFMTPEFMFRGKYGAYGMDDYQLAISQLKELVKDAQFSDWLFVFGSLIAVSSPHTHPWFKDLFNREFEVDTSKVQEIYNVVFIQKGGFGDSASAGDAGARAVMKEFKSQMDFISERANRGGHLGGQVRPLEAKATGSGKERQLHNYDGLGIFTQDGITFGVEVCLDHLQQRLRLSPPRTGEQHIQVQLVPACGMDIEPASVVALSGGLVFNCNGIKPSSAVRKVDTMCSAFAQATLSDPTGGRRQEVNVISDGAEALFAEGAGDVHVYKPLAVPAAAVVA